MFITPEELDVERVKLEFIRVLLSVRENLIGQEVADITEKIKEVVKSVNLQGV
jgi:hypothetical protein